MSKRFILIAGLMLLLLAFPVFSSGKQAAATEGPTSLDVWQHKEAGVNDMTKLMIEKFEAENPGKKINLEIFEEVAGYNTKLVTAISGGGGPDVFDVNAVTAGAYNARGMLQPADITEAGYASLAEFEKLYVEGALNAFKNSKGELLGIPFELSVWQLFVNKKYLQDAGVAYSKTEFITWKEHIDRCVKLHAQTGKKGYQLPFGGPFGWYLIIWEPHLWQYGGRIFDENQKSALDSQATRDTMQLWLDIYKNYKTGCTSEYPGANPVFEFAQGDSATTIAGPWAIGTIDSVNPDTSPHIDVVPSPQVDPADPKLVMNSWGNFINVHTKKVGLASHYISYFAKYSLDAFLAGGPMQPTKEVFTDPKAKAKPGFAVFQDGLKYAKAREGTPYYDETGEAIKTTVDNIVLLGNDMDQEVGKLHAEINRIQSQ